MSLDSILEREEFKNVNPLLKEFLIIAMRKRRKLQEIEKFFDREEDARIFINAIKPSQISDIMISNNYIVFVKNAPTRRIEYVVGVNPDTGKLFIEMLQFITYPSYFLAVLNGIKIYHIDDATVWRSFNYNVDFDLSDPKEIEHAIEYYSSLTARIQGDLIVGLTKNGLEIYHERLLLSLKSFIENQMLISIRRRVNNIVGQYFDVEENDEIISNIVDKEYINDAIKFIVNKIYEELKIDDWLSWFGVEKLRTSRLSGLLTISFDDVKIEIEMYSYKDHGLIFIPIRIETRIDFENKKLREIYNEILSQLEWRPVEELHGRHRIYISNALPTRVAVPIQFPWGTEIFTANLPLVARGFVRIEHPEHRTKMLYLTDPVLLTFSNLRTGISDRRNYYRIKYKYYLNS